MVKLYTYTTRLAGTPNQRQNHARKLELSCVTVYWVWDGVRVS